MEGKGNEVLKTYKKLVTERTPLDEYWRDAFQYSYPIRGEGFWTQSVDGVMNASAAKDKQAKIYDSTATDSCRLLASSLISGLTPASQQWFNLMIPNVPDAQIPRPVRAWLQQSSEIMHSMIHSSNYNSQAYEFFLDIAIAGMCGLYVEQNQTTGKLHFETWALYSLYSADSGKAEKIDSVYRKVLMTAAEAILKFGTDNLPNDVRRAHEEDAYCTKKFPFIHTIRPRAGKKRYARMKDQKPYESIYVYEKDGSVVFEGGYDTFPVIIPRWMVIPGTDYAVGPLNETLPDVKTLNKVVEMVLTNGEMAIAGTFVAKDDGVLNPNTIRIGPRRVVFAADPDNIRPLASGGNFQLAGAEINRLQAQVRKTMMSDELAPFNQSREMTAEEIKTRTTLIRQILGPTFSRLQAEFLNPLIERVFDIAVRSGMLGQPPQELAMFNFVPQYSSPLARAQRYDEVQAMDKFESALGGIATQLDKEVLDLYDMDKAIQKRAELLGLPVELIRDLGEVETIRRQRAQQEQQAQQMALLQSAASQLPEQQVKGLAQQVL